jgi:hypothetical protein
MAIVYRVVDQSSGEELALKQLVLRTKRVARQLRAHFEREFYVLAQLSHPSVIAVHDFGVESTGPYYTMELLDGDDLSAQAPLEFGRACQLALQLCSSLSLLHSRKLIHRDIGPRNVRCTKSGSAKLIDFGAMAPMGPGAQVVGTPSFVAPEVLRRMPLDARTDLFSLGATLYFALTGRKPFAARNFSELDEAWREPPLPPSHLAPEIPEALDALVLSLLRIDPAQRPRSAFEVIQRLTAIAGITQAEPEQIAQAYLSTPELVGRDAEVQRFRQRLDGALHGDGGTLLLEGEPGLGRSRLLEMCSVEAKQAGFAVLCVNGRAASRISLSSAFALAERALEQLPELALSCASQDQLEALFDTSDGADAPGPARPRLRALPQLLSERGGAQAALGQWLHNLCAVKPLLLAVDDIERIDDSSLAWITTFARHQGPRRMLIVATLDSSTEASARPALGLLREQAVQAKLSPLSRAQTEELFASMFAGAPNVALVSDRVHRVAAGNLRESLALVRYMLDVRLIRYAEATWLLPSELALSQLPASVEDTLRARVARLPELARFIAQTQALTFDGPWTRDDYHRLAATHRQEEIASALATLVEQGVLIANGATYTLSNLGLKASLAAGIDPAEIANHHHVLAELCVSSGRHVIVEVHHRLRAGAVERALDRLAALLVRTSDVSSLYEWSSVERLSVAALLEHAIVLAGERKRPAREIFEIRQRLVELGQTTTETLHQRHAGPFREQLERDAGVTDYWSASPERPHAERLQEALATAAARYESASTLERVYRPREALYLLVHLFVMGSTFAIRASDTAYFAGWLARLEPFAGISPLLDALFRYASAIPHAHYGGQPALARARFLEVHDRFERLTGEEFPYFDQKQHSVLALLAVLAVTLGDRDAEQRIEAMARAPLQRMRALHLRRMLCVFDGDTRGAEHSRREAELLAIQTGGRGLVPAPPLLDLCAQLHAGDLAGVKHVADRIEELAKTATGWRALHHVAQAAFQRLRGDFSAALEAVERGLALIDPTCVDPLPQLNVWALAASEYVSVLFDLGRFDRARAEGLRLCRQCEALAITDLAAGLQRALALCEAKLGDHVAAARRLDALIASRAHCRPSFRAVDYEARARVAIWAKDATSAQRFVELATRPDGTQVPSELRRGRLLDEALRVGLALDSADPQSEPQVVVRAGERATATAMQRRLAQLDRQADAASRARHALELLAQVAGARAGYLYYARDASLARAAMLHVQEDASLDRFANGYVRQQLQQAQMTTVFTEETGVATAACARWTNDAGELYQIALLRCRGGHVCVGLVALSGAMDAASSVEYHALSHALSARLLELGDVTPIDAR